MWLRAAAWSSACADAIRSLTFAPLGLAGNASWKLWLQAWWWLPPAQSRAWPPALVALLRALMEVLARGLEMDSRRDRRRWVSALLWRAGPPSSMPTRAAEWPAALPRVLGWLLQPLLPVLAAGPRWMSARLDRVDFRRAERRVERMALASMGHSHTLRVLLMVGAALLFWFAATTPLSWSQQLLVLVVLWGAAMLIRRMPGGLPALLLIGLSILASARYIWWRLTATLELEGVIDHVLGAGLVAAEIYTWLIMVLGYVQNAWPLRRKPVVLPEDRALWPSVDIYVPTYNEPLKVVRPTVLAAQVIDWPADKLKVYILDDGRRPEFREFAKEAGVEYMIRPDNFHAKAGNLNHALTKTQGQLIAIFDCDHIPTRSFLQMTVGWFLHDEKCAMLQTPHHFFSPDPFERNLDVFRRVPNEGNLFYGLVQDGNDLWNATFFCGSCAVIRRGPLLEVGGIAVETVTEDAHTALKLHRLGYTTAYLNLRQAAGLATESLSGHVGQRIRWARGMAQIFRVDNPLFGKGLTLLQRLCYCNAMLHFFYGLPRLVFLTAPLAYLYFEIHIISAGAGMLALYALPHLIQAGLANSRVQGEYRHSFWAEAYETVLAWYIARPTTVALIAPKIGKFNVTVKGGLVEKEYFDWQIAKPFLWLAAFNAAGLVMGLLRLTTLQHDETGTVMVNLLWTIYNLILLGTALSVCAEARQVRVEHRIPLSMPARIALEDGREFECQVRDGSISGLGIDGIDAVTLAVGTPVQVLLPRGDETIAFAAHVITAQDRRAGLRFAPMSLAQERDLIRCTFARADAWIDWYDRTDPDRPMSSMVEVLHFGLRGYLHFTRSFAVGLSGALRRRRRPSPSAGVPV